jgi:hypothetical protein
MLGSLARWMRALGYDAAYESAIDDARLAALAIEEGRVVITADTLLAKRRALRGRVVLLEGTDLGKQLRFVTEKFPIPADWFLTRCLRCNALLEKIKKESVADSVAPYVYETQESFAKCPRCDRIYWNGTHGARMIEDLKTLLG